MSVDKYVPVPPPAPVFISLPADDGAHTDPTVDIWYISCSLFAGERQFNTQVVVVTNYGQAITTHAYITEAGTSDSRHEMTGYPSIGDGISTGNLGIQLPNISFSGSTLGGLALRAALGKDSIDITLSLQSPVLYANGTGLFPYHGGGTYQYSLPNLHVSGSLTLDNKQLAVTGQGWFDRQWAASEAAFGSNKGFLWMGLCLSNGDNLSLWDFVAPDGKAYSWVTLLKPDSTHIVAPIELTTAPGDVDERGPWRINIASLDMDLQVSQQAIHDETSFYSGACKISGTAGSEAVTGYGFVDLMQRSG